MNTLRYLSVLLLFFWYGTICSQTPTKQPKGKTPVADTMVVRYDHTPIYDSASYTAGIISDKQKGDTVVVIEKIGKFGRVQLQVSTGFIAKSNLQEVSENPPKQQKISNPIADSVKNSQHSSSPPTTQSHQQPTEHRCKGLTKSGKQCSRNAENGSEYCWQHRPNDGKNDEKKKPSLPDSKP